MTCPARLSGGALTCVRTDDHDPTTLGGHVYVASAGADLAHQGES